MCPTLRRCLQCQGVCALRTACPAIPAKRLRPARPHVVQPVVTLDPDTSLPLACPMHTGSHTPGDHVGGSPVQGSSDVLRGSTDAGRRQPPRCPAGPGTELLKRLLPHSLLFTWPRSLFFPPSLSSSFLPYCGKITNVITLTIFKVTFSDVEHVHLVV